MDHASSCGIYDKIGRCDCGAIVTVPSNKLKELQAENAALKEQLSTLEDDIRVEQMWVQTHSATIKSLKEQVAQLQTIIQEEANDSGNVILELSSLQSKSAALVDALEEIKLLAITASLAAPNVAQIQNHATEALAAFKGEK